MDNHISKPEASVSLRVITKETVRAICKLSDSLSVAHKKMVASNADSIAQAYFEEHTWFRAIYADDEPVGFTMLYDHPEENEYFLWRLMIAGPYQGKGYGRKAIKLLIEYVRSRSGVKELGVSCGEGEGSPEGFYRKLGFEPTGEKAGDEIVLRMKLI